MKHIEVAQQLPLTKEQTIRHYLEQDNAYWLSNDKWDITKGFFFGNKIHARRYIDFSNVRTPKLKNELKYYFLFNFKQELIKPRSLVRLSTALNHFSKFLNAASLRGLDKRNIFAQWKLYLINKGIAFEKSNYSEYFSFSNLVIDFIEDFYDDRDEIEKDIWYSKNIIGAKIPASGSSHTKYSSINFRAIPLYYRETVKKYFRTIITKRSWSHCSEVLKHLVYFLNLFYENGYQDGFIEHLTRSDIERYIYWVNNNLKDKNPTYKSKFISYIRTFLEYIQLAQYEQAPKKEVAFLIFQDDIPKRESHKDTIKKVKFIPEPIAKQLDACIHELERSQYIPIYILLRETGWRGTDILNLRYDNCLEKIWNNKEQIYNYYLCGEITKTEIAQLKIPIRDKVAAMVERCIQETTAYSTDENNPKCYLFNNYKGKLKGTPYRKQTIVFHIQKLIKQKNIMDEYGNPYHFRMHSLRHTRAKEYVEQGMNISIIQQILGHTSLQMTVHYSTVTENTLYEKWKDTEDLNLFRVNTETLQLEEIDTTSKDGENFIRYEYVKKNLDAVRVPFGVCFKPSKMPCKQQMNHCLTCGSFCTTTGNIPEYEEEISKVQQQIDTSIRNGREIWAEKNQQYLSLLQETLDKVKEQKVVHKNGRTREEV